MRLIFLKKLNNWIYWAIIRAGRYPLLKQFLRWKCRLETWRIGRILTKMPGVEAVYIRKTHPKSPSFVPGHSDLDVTIVFTKDAEGNPDQIEAITSKVKSQSQIHYYLNPQDARFTSRRELTRVIRTYDSPYELLYSPSNWILLAGKEGRIGQPKSFPADKTPWHPEFNRMWQYILQNHLLIRIPGIEDQYLRAFYRNTIKQQLYFQAAWGRQIAKPPDYIDDNVVKMAFRENPEVQSLLAGIKHRDFWCKDACCLREQIFFHTLHSALEFFRTYPFHPKINQAAAPFQKNYDNHRKAYELLESKLNQYPELIAMLKGVLTYPVPHRYPYFYHVDLVISDGISFEQFSKIVRMVDEAFKGRGFHLDGYNYWITLILEGIYSRPLVFLGSPFPFMNRHIRRYGKCLLGKAPGALQGSWSPEDLVEWCRVFLPYYILNLSHRIEYSSGTINFCQLASIRLFLETGEIETDPLIIQKRHRELFKDESPNNHLWNYMLKDEPSRQERSVYREAAISLLKEIRWVETLLAKNHSTQKDI